VNWATVLLYSSVRIHWEVSNDAHPPLIVEVMNLVYYQDKSIEEVAKIVGVPTNTVKTRMFYARRRLAELLHETGVDGF